jgi:hypothetical protein
LGRLCDQVVVHAILPVDEEHRRNLKAPAQTIEYTRSHLLLCIARLRRLGSIDRDVKRWIVERLLDMQIGKAGDLVQLNHDLLGDLMAGLYVAAFNLHIDRGGEPEVEDLGHYIRRQKVKGRTGKLTWKLSP